jgi:hypothetical protein
MLPPVCIQRYTQLMSVLKHQAHTQQIDKQPQ